MEAVMIIFAFVSFIVLGLGIHAGLKIPSE